MLIPVVGVSAIAGIASAQTASLPTGPGGGLAAGSVPTPWQAAVLRAGTACRSVSPVLIAAQIEQESGWSPVAVSPAGAVGLSQFMPATWAAQGVDANDDGTALPTDPLDAIATQGKYDCGLAALVAGVPGDPQDNMLAAYNAGPGAVLAAGGVPPIAETQQYVRNIRSLIVGYTAHVAAPAGASGAVLTLAASFVGTPYVWGGAEPGGFDCSGLTSYVYRNARGVILPRTSEAQQAAAVPVTDPKPGDLVFFGRPAGHVGIVLDPAAGTMIDAPHTGANVRTESYQSWSDFSGFGRFP